MVLSFLNIEYVETCKIRSFNHGSCLFDSQNSRNASKSTHISFLLKILNHGPPKGRFFILANQIDDIFSSKPSKNWF